MTSYVSRERFDRLESVVGDRQRMSPFAKDPQRQLLIRFAVHGQQNVERLAGFHTRHWWQITAVDRTHYGGNAGVQLRRFDGLNQVSRRPQLAATSHIARSGARTEHHDHRAAEPPVLADARRQFKAVHVRHMHIAQHNAKRISSVSGAPKFIEREFGRRQAERGACPRRSASPQGSGGWSHCHRRSAPANRPEPEVRRAAVAAIGLSQIAP